MGQNSGIEWTTHTFNPWWGCFKVSQGCSHCYAETLANRYNPGIWGPPETTDRRLFGDKHWMEPLKWDKAAGKLRIRERVFSGSMCDVFEDHDQVKAERARLLTTIEATPNLQWLLLTKRPENIMPFLEEALCVLDDAGYADGIETPGEWLARMGDRVWIGTSVEDQKTADQRIPHLLGVPAQIRFLSMEPLLGPVDLWGARYRQPDGSYTGALTAWAGEGVQWIIVGGESGQGARPMAPAWVRRIRDDSKAIGVPFFFKQWGEWSPVDEEQKATTMASIIGEETLYKIGKKKAGRTLDGETYSEMPGQRLIDVLTS